MLLLPPLLFPFLMSVLRARPAAVGTSITRRAPSLKFFSRKPTRSHTHSPCLVTRSRFLTAPQFHAPPPRFDATSFDLRDPLFDSQQHSELHSSILGPGNTEASRFPRRAKRARSPRFVFLSTEASWHCCFLCHARVL